MAGHSHWAGIKHKKGANDAKRGKLFSKLSKLIMSAARTGGGDPEINLSLRYAIDKARAVSMPKDNIDRAVMKGTGGLQGSELFDVTYEGYGPGGVAILVEALTDNRNRTGAEMRKIFDSKGGNMGQPNCVAWQFEKKGLFAVSKAEGVNGEKLLELALENDAEDLEETDDSYEITCAVENFIKLEGALEEASYKLDVSEITFLPKNTIPLEEEDGRKLLSLLDALEDHDDVQSVSANFELPDGLLEKLESEAE